MRDGNFDAEQRQGTGPLRPGDPVGKRDRPEHDRNGKHDRDCRCEAEHGERQKDHARHGADRDTERLVREGSAEPTRAPWPHECARSGSDPRAGGYPGGPFVSRAISMTTLTIGAACRRGTGARRSFLLGHAPPLLHRRALSIRVLFAPNLSSMTTNPIILRTLMARCGRSVVRYRRIVLVFWLAVVLAGLAGIGRVESRLSSSETLPGLPSFTVSQAILQRYGTGGDNPPVIVVLRLPAGQQVESPAGERSSMRRSHR